jgi:hypothetical protein
MKLREPHTFRWEEETLPDGSILRRPVLSEPERWARENAEDAAAFAKEHPDYEPDYD